MICPGSDGDAWAAKNRAPIYPGKTNVWILVRGNDEALSEPDLTKSLYDAFAFWFDSGPDYAAALEGRARFGFADNLEVEKVSNEVIPRPERLVKRREDLETYPTISAKSLAYVTAVFDYRGDESSIPWPIYSERYLTKGRCPNDSDWMALGIIAPTKDAAPERDAGDVFGDIGDKVTDKLATPFYVLLGVAGILGVAYIVGKLK